MAKNFLIKVIFQYLKGKDEQEIQVNENRQPEYSLSYIIKEIRRYRKEIGFLIWLTIFITESSLIIERSIRTEWMKINFKDIFHIIYEIYNRIIMFYCLYYCNFSNMVFKLDIVKILLNDRIEKLRMNKRKNVKILILPIIMTILLSLAIFSSVLLSYFYENHQFNLFNKLLYPLNLLILSLTFFWFMIINLLIYYKLELSITESEDERIEIKKFKEE